jgi:hypothetical protein
MQTSSDIGIHSEVKRAEGIVRVKVEGHVCNASDLLSEYKIQDVCLVAILNIRLCSKLIGHLPPPPSLWNQWCILQFMG